ARLECPCEPLARAALDARRVLVRPDALAARDHLRDRRVPRGAPAVKYLIDADSTIPNIALMRLGSYFRARGEDVRLVTAPHRRELWDPPGEVFGSSIFKFAERTRERIEREWGAVRWGGTGVRNESSLDEIDASVDWEAMPFDWSLYPDEKRSIG